MKKIIIFLLFFACINYGFGQCNGGTAYLTASAPAAGNSTTISYCTYPGEYNTITGIVSGNSYTLTASPSACITIHTGSASGPVVAYGMGSVTFTAPSSGTYYMVLNVNCTGCGTGSTCLETTIQNNGSSSGPCASISNIPGCGQGFTLNTTGASSYISSLCATATPGLEQIYSYTATSTGNYSFNVTSVTGGGYAIGWLPMSSGCSPTGWNCAGIATVPGSVGSIALTAGVTYYFVMDATSTAASAIGFSLTCPAGGPTTAGDCNVAANVCSNASFAIDPNGYGATDEICTYCTSNPSINVNGTNNGCLISGELNSTWMIVNVLTGGNLTFQLGTPNSGTFNCLDWAMWPYNASTCSGILGGTLAPIRCNYNGSCEEFTGIAGSLPAGATSMTNWEAPLAVGSMTQYIICLSNFSSATTTVPLSFGGTAVVSCSPLGVENIAVLGESKTGYNTLNWTCNLELNTKEFIIEKSIDGEVFKEIGRMQASGFSTTETSYSFDDVNTNLGVSYYRVSSTHENAAPTSSDVISINQLYSKDIEVLRCYPNPANELLTVQINSSKKGEYQIQFVDLNGKNMAFYSQYVEMGITEIQLNISNLDNGFYLLNILDDGKRIETQKIAIE